MLLGEGNLSFDLSLADASEGTGQIVATTFEGQGSVSAERAGNELRLANAGVVVLHNVEATRLGSQFHHKFQTLVFQFPNTGSRRAVYSQTENHHLIRRFLRSAREVLAFNGVVLITTVDSPHHHGVFDIQGAADKTGFVIESLHPFYRSHWSGYRHQNTLDAGSALRATYKACTWVLKAKRRN